MTHWEYDRTDDSYRLGELMEVLEAKGKQGWELASIIELRKTNQQIKYYAIFKRPIES